MTIKNQLCTGLVALVLASCNGGSATTPVSMDSVPKASVQAATIKVTPENFIRAETDRMFYNIEHLPGSGINKFYHFATVTPLNQQTVVRMNRDVLYSGAIVNVEKGATVTFPAIPKGRYASILVVDNDHYCPTVIYTAGKYKLPQDTKYLMLAIRIQVFNAKDTAELALVNKLKQQFIIESNSQEVFAEPTWDKTSLDSMRLINEKEFSKFDRYSDDWMGARGKVNEHTRQFAAAGAWGLFPNKDATYINYNGGNLSGTNGYVATYKVPDVSGFWSITVYGNDGYIKSENCVVNASNVTYNKDKTFTVYFGSADKCPKNIKNRVDITDGWNFLMRCYLPGESVLNGTYKLPAVLQLKN